MRSLALVALLFAFSVTLSYAVHESSFRRELKASASAGSSASSESTAGNSASANAGATSRGGRAFSTAIASAKSRTEVENGFLKFFREIEVKQIPEYYDGSDQGVYCADLYAYIDKELEVVGKVVAEVYSEAIGDVSVEGDGEACANAESRGRAEAIGFAQIMVDAYIKVINKYTQAEARAIVRQRNKFFVSAFAQAYSEACISGEGNAYAIQSVLAEAMAKPIATLAVFLIAEVDCKGEEGFAESFVDAENTAEETVNVDSVSDTGVNGDGTATADGSGDASAKQAIDYPKCQRIEKICCRKNNIDEETCKCSLSTNGPRRCQGNKVDNGNGNGNVHWNINGKICQCS